LDRKKIILVLIILSLLLFAITSISYKDGVIIISPFKDQINAIQKDITDAKGLAQDLGLEKPKRPFFIITCPEVLANTPLLQTFGGHYLPVLNTAFLYQPSANNIYHEYFHFIQDSAYELDFNDTHSFWVLESSARWFENNTLENYREVFDCTEPLFDTPYETRYERWMLFKKLVDCCPNVISSIFQDLKVNQDPCETLNKIPFFQEAFVELITKDFQDNFQRYYKESLNFKNSIIIEPFQFNFTKIDAPLHVTPQNKIYYLVFNKDLKVIEPLPGENGETIYPYCYILGIINACDNQKTIRIFKDNQEGYFYTYLNP